HPQIAIFPNWDLQLGIWDLGFRECDSAFRIGTWAPTRRGRRKGPVLGPTTHYSVFCGDARPAAPAVAEPAPAPGAAASPPPAASPEPHMHMPRMQPRAGFSLIDMIVTISFMAILV